MDTALFLRINKDKGVSFSQNKTAELLEQSVLFSKLIKEPVKTSLERVWRIIALSEIPGSENHVYTQELFYEINNTMFTGSAYSLTGKEEDMLPCYNGMVVAALCKLNLIDSNVSTAVNWILRYQPFNRTTKSTWQGKGTQKYGGCYKDVPCYIGLVKSLDALVEYKNNSGESEVDGVISEGLEYVLSHKLFKRLSNGEPITKHILDLSFPPSYHLNLVDLLLLMKKTNLLQDPRVSDGINYIQSKRKSEDSWKVSFIYKGKGYIPFDLRGKKAEWLSYLFKNILDKYQKGLENES